MYKDVWTFFFFFTGDVAADTPTLFSLYCVQQGMLNITVKGVCYFRTLEYDADNTSTFEIICQLCFQKQQAQVLCASDNSLYTTRVFLSRGPLEQGYDICGGLLTHRSRCARRPGRTLPFSNCRPSVFVAS